MLEDNSKVSISVSRFASNGMLQIPQRLVDNGTISRFGAVDDTEEEILQEQILMLQ
jgi:hypothetical protein